MLITSPAAGHGEGRVEAGAHPEELLGREDGCRGGGEGGGWVRLSSTSDLWTQPPPGRGIQEERGGADMKTVECGAN